MPLLTVTNLWKRFNLEAGFFARLGRYVQAVRGVDFYIDKNESYGLVGESGSGKTTTARLLVRMYEADEGSIVFNDEANGEIDVLSLKKAALKKYRQTVKYVFQDPARSLNPRMTVYEVLTSGRRYSSANTEGKEKGKKRKNEKRDIEDAAAILSEVGLNAEDLWRRPSEFSGGQRQRISIARALIMKPSLLICDEVVSALDVSIQGQILNLLLEMKERRGLSFLFIAHDLKVASYFSDRIGVMYGGELVEEAPAETIFKKRLHPYTELLFSSVSPSPIMPMMEAMAMTKQANERNEREEREEKKSYPIAKEDSSIGACAKGACSKGACSKGACAKGACSKGACAFAPRCPYVQKRCLMEKPELREIAKGHRTRCFLEAQGR